MIGFLSYFLSSYSALLHAAVSMPTSPTFYVYSIYTVTDCSLLGSCFADTNYLPSPSEAPSASRRGLHTSAHTTNIPQPVLTPRVVVTAGMPLSWPVVLDSVSALPCSSSLTLLFSCVLFPASLDSATSSLASSSAALHHVSGLGPPPDPAAPSLHWNSPPPLLTVSSGAPSSGGVSLNGGPLL